MRRASARRGTQVLVAACALAALAACTSGGDANSNGAPSTGSTASSGASVGGGSGSASADAPLPSVGLVGDVPATRWSPDADAISASDLNAATVELLSASSVAVDAADPHAFTVAVQMPGQRAAVLDVHLYAQPGEASAQEPSLQARFVGDAVLFTARYAVDPATLPEDLRTQVMTDLPTQEPVSVIRQAALRAEEGASSIGVLIDGIVGAVTDAVIDEAQGTVKEKALTRLGGERLKDLEEKVGKKAKAGKAVLDALSINDVVSSALETLDELEQCVLHPTNKIVRDRFRAAPADQQRQLKQIADARSEITGHAAAILSGTILDLGLDMGTGWAGKISGPLTGWARDSLMTLIENELRVAKAGVTPCVGYRLFYSPAGSPTVWEGEKCGGLGGRWKAKSNYDFPGGDVTFFVRTTIDEDSLTGPLDYETLGKSSDGNWRTSTKGTVTLIQKADDSIVMKVELGGSTAVRVPNFGGTFGTPIPGGELVWKPDPELARCGDS